MYRRGVYRVPHSYSGIIVHWSQSPVSRFSIFDVLVSLVVLLILFFHLSSLLPPLDGLHSHLQQTILGLAIGEIAKALDGLLGVVLRKRSRLVDAVRFED